MPYRNEGERFLWALKRPQMVFLEDLHHESVPADLEPGEEQ
jgi:hypothetical protein